MKKGITAVISLLSGFSAGYLINGKIKNAAIDKKDCKVDKFRTYYTMLNQWLSLKQEGKTLEGYFIQKHYKEIAIYGMGEMGNRLYDELKNSSVHVKYAIDKNAGSTYSELTVLDPDDTPEPVDAVIVTAVFAFDDIERQLQDKFSCPVISLEDIVYEI